MFESQIQTLLLANVTVTALATGGIYTLDTLGSMGLSRHNPICAATAFDASGNLRPTIVVKGLGEKGTYELVDADTRYLTTEELIQIYIYQHGKNGFNEIRSILTPIYNTLQEQKETGIFKILFQGDVDNMFAQELNDASQIISHYKVYGHKGN